MGRLLGYDAEALDEVLGQPEQKVLEHPGGGLCLDVGAQLATGLARGDGGHRPLVEPVRHGVVGPQERWGVLGGGAGQDRPSQGVAAVEVVAPGDECREDGLERGIGNCRALQGEALVEQLAHEVGVGVALVLEVLVEAALGHSGGSGHPVHGGAAVGAGGELRRQRVQDALTLVLGEVVEGGAGHGNLL